MYIYSRHLTVLCVEWNNNVHKNAWDCILSSSFIYCIHLFFSINAQFVGEFSQSASSVFESKGNHYAFF